MKALVFIIFFLFSICRSFSQNANVMQKIDSLKYRLSETRQDADRVRVMQAISYYYRKSSPDSSLKYGQNAQELAHQIKFFKAEAEALQIMGLFYRGQGDIPKGLELFLDGLQISEDNQYKELSENFLTNIGHIYRDLEDYEKAISYYQRADKICEEFLEDDESGFLLWNIGHIYSINKMQDSAIFYIKKANDKLKLPTVEIKDNAYMNMVMGDIQFQLGNQQLAFDYLYKSLAVSTKSNNYVDRSFAYLTIAEFFKAINKMDSCIYYEKKSLTDAETVGIKRKILEASKLLAEQYESKDIKTSLYYRKIADSAYENLYGVKKVQSLQKIITNELKKQRDLEAEKVAYQNKLKQYGLLAGLGLFLFIALLLYRNIRQKQKANKVLEITLTNLKSTQQQLIQSEKMASLGELTAGIAHEIQNPLNFVNNFSEISKELAEELKKEAQKPEIDKALIAEIVTDIAENQTKINHHGQRASSIVKGMLEHSRTSSGKKELTDINALADEYLRLAYHGLRAKDKDFNAALVTDFDPNLPKIEVIPQDIGRVLLNMINNGFQAIDEQSKRGIKGYKPTLTVTTKLENARVKISVKDNGPGIPEEIKDKIFQPFFTTKPTGMGTGLGLSLAYDIVTKGHSGILEVESIEGVRTEFVFSLPF